MEWSITGSAGVDAKLPGNVGRLPPALGCLETSQKGGLSMTFYLDIPDLETASGQVSCASSNLRLAGAKPQRSRIHTGKLLTPWRQEHRQSRRSMYKETMSRER